MSYSFNEIPDEVIAVIYEVMFGKNALHTVVCKVCNGSGKGEGRQGNCRECGGGGTVWDDNPPKFDPLMELSDLQREFALVFAKHFDPPLLEFRDAEPLFPTDAGTAIYAGWALINKKTLPTPPRITRDARALGIFLSDPEKYCVKARIAERLDVKPQALSPDRCPELNKAIRFFKAKDGAALKGFKDKYGDVEAWDDQQDKHTD